VNVALALPPSVEPTASPFEGDGLRRLVRRHYERRLVERGFARPELAATVEADDEQLDDQDDNGAPNEKLAPIDAKLAGELESWLARVVLVDGEKHFRATELGRPFAERWARAGGYALPPPRLRVTHSIDIGRHFGPVTALAVGVAVGAAQPVSSPLGTNAAPAATPANDKEGGMPKDRNDLGDRDARILQGFEAGKDAQTIANELQTTKVAIYTVKSRLKKLGFLDAISGLPATHAGPAPSKRRPPTKAARPAARVTKASPVVEEDAELIAPLRARLEALDTKREAIAVAIRALGGEA